MQEASKETPLTNNEATPEQEQEQTQQQRAEELNALRAKIEELQKQSETFKDQLLRKAAEFENYKRRTENDFSNLSKTANESLLVDLIPILDDFLRSMKLSKESTDVESLFKGFEMIFNKFSRTLEAKGLVPFDSVGKPFDVDYHDALLQIPNDSVPPHTVLEEVERGYMLFDKVVRHAKVIVSTDAAPAPEGKDVN